MKQDDVQIPSSNLIDLDNTYSQTHNSSPTNNPRNKNLDGTPHVSNRSSNESSTSNVLTNIDTKSNTKNNGEDESSLQSDKPDTTKKITPLPLSNLSSNVLHEEGNVYLNLAKVLLVIVVIVAMLYVVYWVLQNVYKIDLLQKGKEWVGMDIFSSTPTGQSLYENTSPPTPPSHDVDMLQYNTNVSPAPHADGTYNTSSQGVQMKKKLSDKSISALLDLMANIK